jgi:hypothetical protein
VKPGDFIEWTYKHNNSRLVSQDETLWSTPERRWVPIGLTSLLVWITDKEYAWLTPDGLFHAHRDDAPTLDSPSGCSTHTGMMWRGRTSSIEIEGLFHAHRDVL